MSKRTFYGIAKIAIPAIFDMPKKFYSAIFLAKKWRDGWTYIFAMLKVSVQPFFWLKNGRLDIFAIGPSSYWTISKMDIFVFGHFDLEPCNDLRINVKDKKPYNHSYCIITYQAFPDALQRIIPQLFIFILPK